jgi:hypothetical protein
MPWSNGVVCVACNVWHLISKQTQGFRGFQASPRGISLEQLPGVKLLDPVAIAAPAVDLHFSRHNEVGFQKLR